MATIRIRVVASADASLGNVFVPFQAAAKRASAAVAADLGAGAAQGAHPYRSMPAMVAPGFAGVGRAAKQMGGELGSVADGAKAKFAQLESGLRALPVSLSAVANAAQRELAKIERARANEMLGIGPKGPGFFSTSVRPSFRTAARVGTRIGMGALNAGMRLGSDLLQGIGVNTDVSSMFQQNTELESRAQDIQNFGYMPGQKGPNGQRVDTGELIRDAHKTAQETGNSASDVLGGLEKFVGLTGDLNTGRAAMKDLAVLSKATGSNLEEMVEAAGNASNVLGDIPDKGKAVYEVMKAVAGEGKTGAVLIKDLATQMAKVAAGAQSFTGDRSQNIAVLGAIAQEARGRGGSASAAQAATSVSSFVNTFSKAARLRAFQGFGVEVQGAGGLRDARDIIVDSLNAAMRGGKRVTPQGHTVTAEGGDKRFSENLGQMFMDVRARSAVRGFESIYRETYAGAHGDEKAKEAAATAAVRAEFERLTSAAMSEAVVQEDFKRAMATTKSKVEVFNDKMTAAAGKIQEELVPALIELTPAVLDVTKGLVDFVDGIFGRRGAAQVHDSTVVTNSLAPVLKAVGGDEATVPMVWNPNAGDVVVNPKTGLKEKTGEWERGKTEVPEGTQEFVQAKLAERQQALADAKAKETKAKKALHDRITNGNQDPDAESTARELVNDPTKLRSMQDSMFDALTGNAPYAADILATHQSVESAEKDLASTQVLADKLAEGIANKTISVHLRSSDVPFGAPAAPPGPARPMPAESADSNGAP